MGESRMPYLKQRIKAANDCLYKYEKYIDAEKYEQILYSSINEQINFNINLFKTLLVMERNAIGLRRFIRRNWWKIKIDSIRYNMRYKKYYKPPLFSPELIKKINDLDSSGKKIQNDIKNRFQNDSNT